MLSTRCNRLLRYNTLLLTHKQTTTMIPVAGVMIDTQHNSNNIVYQRCDYSSNNNNKDEQDIFEQKKADFFKNVLNKKMTKEQLEQREQDEKHLAQQQSPSQKSHQQQQQSQTHQQQRQVMNNEEEEDKIYERLDLSKPMNPKEELETLLARIIVDKDHINSQSEQQLIDKITESLMSKEDVMTINATCDKQFQEARGHYVAGFHDKALHMFKQIDARHGMTNIFLGNIYFTGIIHGTPNMQLAYQHFDRAAHARVPVAFGMLGEMFLKGFGMDLPNPQRARTYFDVAASMALKSSMEQLVFMVINQIGGEFNLAKASYYLKQLAQLKGDVQAVVTLGGILFEQDRSIAVQLWTFASRLGNADAMYYLGRYYYTRSIPDYNHAFTLWSKASEMGNANAQFCLGGMYDMGLIVERNIRTAIQLYEASALQGNVNAQFLLGKFYLQGQGIEVDVAEATKWLQMAAKQGDMAAIQLIQEMNNKDEE
ncbi:hypothetical protein SAMD00019534_098750, partial [Acytostelium subglobosum LB1]|uniref:hypothetical protein n=1 Tax=Acytostelium subglobosum LB1 TaxID=1410327 RepID=UPI0006451957